MATQCVFELCTPRTHGAPDSERDKKNKKQKKTKKQTPHFRNYSRRALYDLPQILHCDSTEPGLGHWKEFFFVFTHVRVNFKYVREVIRTCVKFTYVRIPMYKQMRETVSFYVNIWACTWSYTHVRKVHVHTYTQVQADAWTMSMYLKFHVGT